MSKRKPKRQKKANLSGMPPAGDIGGDKLRGRDGGTGRFLPGNRFWEARSSAGPKPKFVDGETLWAACVEYFAWVEANPLWEDHLVTFQGMAKHEAMAKMRAMTITHMCLFLDVEERSWREWRSTRADLLPVITRAEAVIRSQKFAGAAADLLNANIIARDLGLADKSEFTGKDGEPLMPNETGDIDQARRVAFALGRALERQRLKVSDASG